MTRNRTSAGALRAATPAGLLGCKNLAVLEGGLEGFDKTIRQAAAPMEGRLGMDEATAHFRARAAVEIAALIQQRGAERPVRRIKKVQGGCGSRTNALRASSPALCARHSCQRWLRRIVCTPMTESANAAGTASSGSPGQCASRVHCSHPPDACHAGRIQEQSLHSICSRVTITVHTMSRATGDKREPTSNQKLGPLMLPAVVLLLSLSAAVPLAAQCVVENPGGSKANSNRPSDEDVQPAEFSPLSYLNRELPDWLCLTAGYRTRFESYSAGNFQAGNSDSYLLTRFRFGMLVKPAGWFTVFTEVQDATAFWKTPPLAPPYQDTWDLRRAYVTLGNTEKGRVAVEVGRQDLNFGYGRLVGTSYWRNASRGFDAAMAFLNWDWIHVNAFAAAPVILQDNGLSHHQEGNDLHGLYASFNKLVQDAVVEPYVFWRLSRGIKTEEGQFAKLDEKTAGLRWAGTWSRFDYDTEIADQFGNIGPDEIRARAWSAIAGYTVKPGGLKTRVFIKYDFASGDGNPKDGVHGTFDQLYPNLHDHHGLADQIAWQNLKSVRSGVRFSLRHNWILASAYNGWWLASANDAFYSSSGSIVARDTKGLSGTHIGDEYDMQTSYRFDRDLELGIGLGHIHSGEFLLRTNHAPAYTYPYVMLNYNFF